MVGALGGGGEDDSLPLHTKLSYKVATIHIHRHHVTSQGPFFRSLLHHHHNLNK
jgi:hypothetical protein